MKCNSCKLSIYLSFPLSWLVQISGRERKDSERAALAWPFFASRVNTVRIPECKIFLGPAAKLFNYESVCPGGPLILRQVRSVSCSSACWHQGYVSYTLTICVCLYFLFWDAHPFYIWQLGFMIKDVMLLFQNDFEWNTTLVILLTISLGSNHESQHLSWPSSSTGRVLEIYRPS